MNLWFDPFIGQVYPEYISDLKAYYCPSNINTWAAAVAEDGDPPIWWITPNDGWANESWPKEIVDLAKKKVAAGASGSCDDLNYRRSYCIPMSPGGQSYAIMPSTMKGEWLHDQADAFETLIQIMNSEVDEMADGSIEFTLPSNGEVVTSFVLREGIERFMITDINNPAGAAQAQSQLPLMFDYFGTDGLNGELDAGSFAHVPGGVNVLAMDGHVEWVKYPSDINATGVQIIGLENFPLAVYNY